MATPRINEIRIDQPSTDNDEYFELFGDPNQSLDGLSYIVIGDGSGGSGVVEAVIDLTGQTFDANGFFVAAESSFSLGVADLVANLNFENSDNVTHLLVSDFVGAVGDDLDSDDDGVLDVTPFTEIDSVALVESPGSGEQVYSDTVVGPDGTFVPSHIFRATDGIGDFQIGAFDPTGGNDTPGTSNTAPPSGDTVFINEIRIDQPGADNDEYFELFGDPNQSLDGLSYIVIGDGSEGSGVVEAVVDLTGQTLDADGFFLAAESSFSLGAADLVGSLNFENSDNVTHLLVRDFTGALNDDLDTDDDGVLDATPFTEIDSVALVESPGVGEQVYSATVVGPDGSSVPGHVFRSTDGTGDFQIGAFDPAGGDDTPGASNAAPPPPPPEGIVINEIDADTPGTDAAEFVELFDGGVGNTALDGLTLVFFNGNGDAAYDVFDLDGFTTNAEGYFLLGNAGLSPDIVFGSNGLQNGADAVALYAGDFADGTAATSDNLIDAIVYGTGDADDAGLLAALNRTVQFNDTATTSIGRDPNGNGEFATQIFPTPGFDNDTLPPTTAAAIYEIQGAGHRSPFGGEAVTTSGIVTAVDSNGFYLQDATGDDDIATSDGIFVFTGSAPTVAVGDEAQVSSFVEERQFSPDLSLTRLASVFDVEVLTTDNALPDAIILGEGGRQAPTEVIDDDGLTSFDPTTDGIDFYESLEGMLVTVPDAVVVAPTNGFDEIWTVADGGATATGLNANGGITIDPNDFNPERIQIQADETLTPGGAPATNTGDSLGDVTGVVSYSFGNFEVRATEAITPVSGGQTQETTELVGTTDQLTIASYNVENLDPKVEDVSLVNNQDEDNVDDNVGDGKFDAIAEQIVNNLNAPDIVALQEVQDNDGGEITDVVDASLTYQTLIDAIVAAGGPEYAYFDLPPEKGQDGGQPGGNIRVGYLYNPDRVSLDESSAVRILDTDLSDGDSFQATRKPLAVEFTFNDQTVHIVNNHFSSKGGSTSLFGETQPPINGREQERTEQAEIVNAFVDGILAADADAKVVVLGDINEFDFNPPLDALKGEDDALVNLTERFSVRERYTFNFQGNAQSLDHVLVAASLAGVALAEIDIVHANTEFADQASDHDPSVLLLAVARSDLIFTDGNDSTFSRDFRDFDFSGDDFLNAFAGNDRVFAKGGDDTVLGGDGKDRLNGGRGDDTVYGQEGDDRVWGEDGNDMLFGNEGRDRVWGGDGHDQIDGGAGEDRLYGGDDDDTIRGGDDDDRLHGQRGNDWLFGDEGHDRLYGDRGHDWLFGGGGDDRLDGGRDDDMLDGGAGNDRLEGRSGNDVLIGGAGDDIVDGGSGSDIYVFGMGDGHDIFRDFEIPGGRGDDDDDDNDDDDDDDHGGLNFDRIDLVDFEFDGFGDVAALFEDAGRDTVIHFDLETSITLVNVDTSALLVHSEVFILV